MTLWERIKKAFKGYLEKMAKENEKSFGSRTLDCCRLNAEQSGKRQ